MTKKKAPGVNVRTVDKDIAALALILLMTAAETLSIAEIADKLRVSAIAVYKWLQGGPMAPPYAFMIVVKMRHRLPKIPHKKRRDQAARLLAAIEADLGAEV